MLSKVKFYLAGILAFAAMMLTAWLSGRSSGKDEVKSEVQKENLDVATAQVKEQKVVNKIDAGVARSTDSAVDSELSDNWTRD